MFCQEGGQFAIITCSGVFGMQALEVDGRTRDKLFTATFTGRLPAHFAVSHYADKDSVLCNTNP